MTEARETRDRGFPGASARRESLHQTSRRDAADWRKGAEGELAVGRMLDDLVVAGVRAVHDRRVPGSLGNIDHIAIAPTGVYVIDAKNYTGHPRVETSNSGDAILQHLYVGGEECSELVWGVRRQVSVVAAALGDDTVPVRGILCFVGAGWEVLNGYVVSRVGITSPERLAALLETPGPLDARRIGQLHRRLLTALDAA